MQRLFQAALHMQLHMHKQMALACKMSCISCAQDAGRLVAQSKEEFVQEGFVLREHLHNESIIVLGLMLTASKHLLLAGQPRSSEDELIKRRSTPFAKPSFLKHH